MWSILQPWPALHPVMEVVKTTLFCYPRPWSLTMILIVPLLFEICSPHSQEEKCQTWCSSLAHYQVLLRCHYNWSFSAAPVSYLLLHNVSDHSLHLNHNHITWYFRVANLGHKICLCYPVAFCMTDCGVRWDFLWITEYTLSHKKGYEPILS